MFCLLVFFFFNDTATTEIYTLSLHDALPISAAPARRRAAAGAGHLRPRQARSRPCATENVVDDLDRKSTRLNSSHLVISYAVFCLKKKKSTAKNSSVDSRYNSETSSSIAHSS